MSLCATSSQQCHRATRSGCVVSAIALLVGLLVGPVAVHATIITFEFAGEVDFVIDNSNLLGGSVTIGTPISGTYSFDSTTPDANPDPRIGSYTDAVNVVGGSLGSFLFTGPSGAEHRIGVVRGNTSQAYSAIVDATLNGEIVQFSVALADSGTTLFPNDELPTSPPVLSGIDSVNIGFVSEDIGLNVHGQLTSLALVPEPVFAPAVVLLSILVLRRARKGCVSTKRAPLRRSPATVTRLECKPRPNDGSFLRMAALVIPCAMGSLMWSSAAHAELVTFAFEGEVDFVMDNSNLLGGSVSIGTPISGIYSFDSTTPDGNPTDGRFGDYYDALIGVAGNLGSFSFAGPSGAQNVIGVTLGSTSQAYSVIADSTLNEQLVQFSVALADSGTTLFPNDELPMSPPALSGIDSVNIGFVAEDIGLNVSGKITSLFLVPEPNTLAVLVIAAVAVVRRRPLQPSRVPLS